MIILFWYLTRSRAAFFGTRIILRQVSPESESIYDLIISLYKHCNGDWSQLSKEAGVENAEVQQFLEYATQFLGNLGNYKGFGDAKFVPRCSPQVLEKIASTSSEARRYYEGCKNSIYADETKPALMHFGFPGNEHMSNYYPESPDITQQEIENIGEVLGKKKLLPENTRLRKTKTGDYEVLIASALSNPPASDVDVGSETSWALENGRKISLVFGDHQEEMAKIALHIKKAGQHAANETQKQMMDAYARSFGTGSLVAFKESQKLWVKDLGPVVESNIGFIETYRDPAGIRGEWEGFAAMVCKFSILMPVRSTPQLIWSSNC